MSKPTLNRVYGDGFEIKRTNEGFKMTLVYNMGFKITKYINEKMSDNAKDVKEAGFDWWYHLTELN